MQRVISWQEIKNGERFLSDQYSVTYRVPDVGMVMVSPRVEQEIAAWEKETGGKSTCVLNVAHVKRPLYWYLIDHYEPGA